MDGQNYKDDYDGSNYLEQLLYENIANSKLSENGQKIAEIIDYIRAGRYLVASDCYIKAMDLVNDQSIRGARPEEIADAFVKACFNSTRDQVRTSNKNTGPIKIGTSGYRALTGIGHTIKRDGLLTKAVTTTMFSELYLKMTKLTKEEVQKMGVVVSRDPRFMGEELLEAVIGELQAAGIKNIYCLDMASTPETSTAIAQFGAAFSINLTPSHNPSPYHGFKVNGLDGGPAESVLTDMIEKEANCLIEESGDSPYQKKEINKESIEYVDGLAAYAAFIKEHDSMIKDFV